MAKPRISLRLRVILLFLAVLTGLAAVATAADTTDWCWYPTAALPPPTRSEHGATLVKLPGDVSAVLVVGGWYQNKSGAFEPITNSLIYRLTQQKWAPAPSLSLKTGRFGNTVTRLADGTVLVAGGYQITDPKTLHNTSIKDCELLDPAQEQGNSAGPGPLNVARDHQTATLLSVKNQPYYGQVLVVGGLQYNDSTLPTSILQTSELYDPVSKSWDKTKIATLTVPRVGHTATLLPDGRVLVTGGHMLDGAKYPPAPYWTAISTCEIWDPNSNTWSPVKSLNHARVFHTATLLSDDPQDQNYGKVLVAGGFTYVFDAANTMYNGPQLNSYEIYDPAKDTWTCPTDQDANDHLQHRRACHTATRLNDGTVLLAGGASATYSSEIYGPDPQDPSNPWQWTYTTSLWYPRSGITGFTATLLDNSDGWVLLVGGGPDLCELFTPPKLILPAGVAAPMLPGN